MQITPNLGSHSVAFEEQEFEPNRHEELHVDGENSGAVILVELGRLIGGEWRHALALEEGADDGGVFGVLEERTEALGGESNILVESERFDLVVVDTDPAVGVADGDVEGEVVVERVVGEREARERGVADVKFEDVGANDEPEEKHEYASDDEHGGEDLADEADDAVEDAPAAAAQAPAPTSTSAAGSAAVGLLRRRNRGTVVRAV